jgi:hypothetical protein
MVCLDRILETGNFATFAPMLVVQNYTYIMNDHNTLCLLNDDDYEFIFLTTYVLKGNYFFLIIKQIYYYFHWICNDCQDCKRERICA